MSDLGNSMDLPYEEGPRDQYMDLDNAIISGGVIVIAATLPIPDAGVKPALIFRFANPDGSGFYDPMVLVCDDDQLTKTGGVITEAAAGAILRAKEENRA